MATLYTGTSYELSQGSSVMNENKEFIYVKLTDSALRAIENYEYQRNPVSRQKILLSLLSILLHLKKVQPDNLFFFV